MSSGALDSAFDPERRRRHSTVKPLMDELRIRGHRWIDARTWALTEVTAGRRPAWKPADMPIQTPNPTVVEAYLDHLDTTSERNTR